jgi:hypothetical protein
MNIIQDINQLKFEEIDYSSSYFVNFNLINTYFNNCSILLIYLQIYNIGFYVAIYLLTFNILLTLIFLTKFINLR